MIYGLQKAPMGKRISAFLFDAILLSIVVAAFAFLFSVIFNYDSYATQLDQAYQNYSEKFGISFDLTEEEYNKLTEEELGKYQAALEALNNDVEVLGIYSMLVNLTILITTLGLIFGFLILEFIVPLIFGNGQTLGKKIFSLGVMRVDSVKITSLGLFIRTIIGKYTIGTMVPVMLIIMIYFGHLGIVGTVVIGLILLLQIAVMIKTETNSCIHDCLAQTVVVDMTTQMMFDTQEQLLKYREERAKENAERSTY